MENRGNLTGYFGDKDVRLDDNKIWKNNDRKKFAEHLYNTGFDIRFWIRAIQS
jgi:hypothetical protein